MPRLKLSTPRPPIRHPIGRDADPTVDHHTQDNRDDVATLLYLHYDGTLASRPNVGSHRSGALTGCELHPRMVSDLEIASAIERASQERRLVATVLWLKYGADWVDPQGNAKRGLPIAEIARRTRQSKEAIRELLDFALDRLIDFIYVDQG